MPLKQLQVVKKVKYLVSNIFVTKKQIVDEVKRDAKEHLIINDRQEKEDADKVDHAVKELKADNKITDGTYSLIILALSISVLANAILIATLAVVWSFMTK